MACGTLICAHQNEFNSAILGSDAHYFSSARNVTDGAGKYQKTRDELKKVQNNLDKIWVKNVYTWGKSLTDTNFFYIPAD